ncbi:MAG TPA: hypothetical protein VEU30_11675 [Thermoanaerobaculia bacterium]|nr:hypothetical protein [Thermoanaerobaculia bacterium]
MTTNRFDAYRAIENHRGNPLIVYVTSTRPNVAAMMAPDAVRQFIDQIDGIASGEKVDVLLHSTGGDGLTAWKLMSILRERFTDITVLVPSMAFSAATMFALGANSIVMHPHASLGPIDPQVTVTTAEGKQRLFSYEDVGAFIRFLSEEVRITEQVHTSAIIDRLFAAVDPLNVGAAKRASELSTSVGERLLRMHLPKETIERAREIAERLNKTFFAHADAVSRRRARELELQIAPDDRPLEHLMWQAYLAIEEYMEMRKPFEPLQLFLSDPTARASVAPAAPLILPSNTHPQHAQNAWNAALQQALTNQQTGTACEVPYTVTYALVESVRVASEFRQDGTISASRLPSGEFQVSIVTTKSGWRDAVLPKMDLPVPQPLLPT